MGTKLHKDFVTLVGLLILVSIQGEEKRRSECGKMMTLNRANVVGTRRLLA